MTKRSTSLKYTGFFNELPTTLKIFLKNCDYECKKRTLKGLIGIEVSSGINNAIIDFEKGIKCGARDSDGIWTRYLRLNFGNLEK